MKVAVGLFIIFISLIFINSCKKEYSCENCKGNKPPVANAGADQIIVVPKDSVTLDGTASFDPDGTITSYKWIKISGPLSSSILKTDSSKTLVKTLVMGVYKFELTVTDNGGLSAKDTVQIIVNDPAHNQPPIANAGVDQTITLPTDTVSLNGNLSFDPDGTIVSYQWIKVSGPSSFNILNPNSVQTKVNSLVQGVYQFELKVTDNGGLIGKDTVQVIVNAVASTNIPPIAKAGNDTSANYDLQTCSINPGTLTLNGSASYDPDGTVVSYLWTGPGTISNPNSATIQVSNLLPGTNTFILKVTDNNGATNEDTVIVTVINLMNRPRVPAQLIPIGTLSQTRSPITIGAAGNKILFAGGGFSTTPCASSRVDIYDIVTSSWTTAELSEARYGMGMATLGNKIFFGGGVSPRNFANSTTCYIGNSWFPDTGSSAVDIYDASSNTWSTSQLSTRRAPKGAAAGNKVIFAGGDLFNAFPSNVVNIYDEASNTWTNTTITEAKSLPQIATAGSKIYLAGGGANLDADNGGLGFSRRIDIYDALSNSWSVDFLSMERAEMGSISVNNKMYWAGGWVLSTDPNSYYPETTSSVEIRDLATNTTSFSCLSQARAPVTALKKNNKILFFDTYSSTFDIYDLTTSSWSIGELPLAIREYSILSYNNTVYVAGAYVNGVLSNQVWKLEF